MIAKNLTEATAQYGVTMSRAFYIAARLYNSGSVDPSGNLQAGIATHCYSSDIANRLTVRFYPPPEWLVLSTSTDILFQGWVFAQHTCPYDG